MAERLLGQTTFADLARREARGDSPRLIINTTLYNSGRRFALTTLPPEASRYDFYADLRASMTRRGADDGVPAGLPAALGEAAHPYPAGARHRSVPHPAGRGRGGVGVFPPLVGPITFHVGDEDLYWHTGDGGLYENQGFESLLFVFLRSCRSKTARRALILAFDSSFPFASGSGSSLAAPSPSALEL